MRIKAPPAVVKSWWAHDRGQTGAVEKGQPGQVEADDGSPGVAKVGQDTEEDASAAHVQFSADLRRSAERVEMDDEDLE